MTDKEQIITLKMQMREYQRGNGLGGFYFLVSVCWLYQQRFINYFKQQQNLKKAPGKTEPRVKPPCGALHFPRRLVL
ncbi:hypothetical protein CGZ75_05660 [Paenibacillus herberti]|uniref:Uncharacterized protein n=1 Tax=Paenibacillus herberti TaxID=1619309 RepID=A0A229P1Q1_9BACL|nr:hypothetical protein CGZ75_05660 [Paenibacillus herberti]